MRINKHAIKTTHRKKRRFTKWLPIYKHMRQKRKRKENFSTFCLLLLGIRIRSFYCRYNFRFRCLIFWIDKIENLFSLFDSLDGYIWTEYGYWQINEMGRSKLNAISQILWDVIGLCGRALVCLPTINFGC